MPRNLFRAIVLCGAVAALAASVPVTVHADEMPADGHFWSELPEGGHFQKAQTLPDFVELAAKLSPAVVNISTEETEAPEGEAAPPGHRGEFSGPPEPFGHERAKSLGSGFIISKDGYILTNEHVVENPRKITVTLQDGTNYNAKVIGRDAKTDIALLKIDAKRDLPVAPLGNSQDVRVGEWVMAIGNPFGFDHSVTAGIVSAKGRFIPGNFDEFIQTDASINPGNSGGPLIDLHGQVIGVNSAIFTRTGSNMGIGFAIPVNLVKEELPQLREKGKVVRGWLGVYIQKITPELAESLGLGDPHGALVAEVLKDGPAQAAGIKRGDVIESYDGQPVSDSRELPLMVARTPLGRRVMLKIIRDKKESELPVVITESQEAKLAEAEQAPKAERGTASQFGLHVKDLSPDLAHELGLDSPIGVVITAVAPGSRADQAGLRARDIILEVNRAAVKNVDAYQQALKGSGKGKIVLLLVKRGDSTTYVPLKPEG
jgi:serine protease Do